MYPEVWFQELWLKEMWAEAMEASRASTGILKKLGMTETGWGDVDTHPRPTQLLSTVRYSCGAASNIRICRWLILARRRVQG